ncbi:RDD family protein [Brevifollis gellanilyticus]|uniref:RDD family protein n=1 Tax=Brevifollis gellanilyticus TaxID=748831 RepID=A0A512M2R4_9BACT|nr:RDD family protein [Brevifollis gellanilyticus]GEP41029.1 RDD family protein [Brevifollis gellanilyticus]
MNYHVARNGQQLGVLSATDISLKLSSGELSPEDLAWAQGMASWQPINSISGLAAGSSFAPPPPPIEVNPYAAPQAAIYHRRNTATTTATELASLGQRLGAYFLNVLTVFPAGLLFALAMSKMDKETEELTSTGMLMMGIALAYSLALLIYNLIRLSTHGQSLGKKWMGIRIASFEDNSNAGFVKAVILRAIVNGLIGAFVPFYGLVDVFFVFREDRRCIHDLLAGTHVVKD